VRLTFPFSQSLVLGLVERVVLVPIVLPVVLISRNTVILNEVVSLKASTDDFAVLVFGYFIVYRRVFLL
jgi:hypothetical protein